MTTLRPTVPLSVPTVAERAAFTGDVTAQRIDGTSDLDTKPDARATRQMQPESATASNATTTAPTTGANGEQIRDAKAIPSNHALTAKEQKKAAKLREKQQKQAAARAAKLNKKKQGSDTTPQTVTPNTPPAQTSSSLTPTNQ